MMSPQMYHQQQAIPTQPYYVPPQYQQAPQYVSMNYSQGAIPQQVKINFFKTYPTADDNSSFPTMVFFRFS
jgi:hypothetical protein